MHTRSLLPKLGLALLAVSPAGPARQAETVRFEPAPGTRLERLYSTTHELSITEVGFSRDGSPLVPDQSGGFLSTWEKIEASDELIEVGDGRPRVLRRTFDEVAAGGELRLTRAGRKHMEDSNVSGSPLRGLTLLFTWIPEEGDWARRYEELHGDEEWLGRVHGDFDALALLPEGPVEPGDSWEIEPEAMRTVLAPGGDLEITPRTGRHFGRTMKVGVGGDLHNVLGPGMAGTAKATFTGVEERNGVRLARIALECDLLATADRTELYRTAMPEEERREPTRLQDVVIEYTLQATGELLWDLDAGHMRQLDLAGPETYRLSVNKLATEGGSEPVPFSAISSFAGALTLQLVSRPPVDEPEPKAPGATQHDDHDH